MTVFVERPITPHGVQTIAGWSFKRYDISIDGAPIGDAINDAVAATVAATVSPPAADQAGVGFLIVHHGDQGVWVLVDVWIDDLIRQHTFSAPLDRPTEFSLIDPGGPTACVWELPIHGYERDAFVRHMMNGPTGPDVFGYLNDQMRRTVPASKPLPTTLTTVGILAFDDVDLLDLGGPYEVFLTADRLARRSNHPGLFDVTVVGVNDQPVAAYGGLRLIPDQAVKEDTTFDIVLIPGAIAIDDVATRPAVQQAVAALVQHASIRTSVCTGAFLLGDQGLLADVSWTTHHEDVGDLGARIGSSTGQTHVVWVDGGDVVTSGGLSSGIAMALHLVERIAGRKLAVKTARQLEYVWDPDWGVSDTIDA